MIPIKNLTGQRFGKWTVINRALNRKHISYWICQCDCGNIHEVQGNNLKSNKSKQCQSCRNKIHKTLHGMRYTNLYNTWRAMKSRCLNPNHISYMDYGGRGITIEDKRWLIFENFFKDMGNRPKGFTLDRRDNNKGYYKENCRWTTMREQRINRRGKYE